MQTQGGAMYLVFPVIVIVLSALFILQHWTEVENKHSQYHYDFVMTGKTRYKVNP